MNNKRFLTFIKICTVLFFLTVLGSYIYWIYACGAVSSIENEYIERIEVPSGMTVKQVASLLKEKKLIHNEYVFYLVARYPFLAKLQIDKFHKTSFKLKSGVYEVKSSQSLSEIFNLLSSGNQEYIKVSIAEGLSLTKIAKKLDSENICSAKDFLQVSHSEKLLKEYNIPSSSFEGFLFPDTYFMITKMDAEKVLRMFVDNFFKKISTIDSFKTLSSKELYDNIILASIVEREYRVEKEAPLIASVFKNRLEKNIGLYSCATIEYILTEIQGKSHPNVITYDDLKIDSPYNTYKWAGLTPSPISNPGMTAIEAVANTPKTNYYFFRLTDAEKGSHSFSSNFQTHIDEGQQLYTKKSSGN